MFANITRGGQTFVHQFQMFWQMFKKATILGIVTFSITIGAYMYYKVPSYIWGQCFVYSQAYVYSSIDAIPYLGSSFGRKKLSYVSYDGRYVSNMEANSSYILKNKEINHNIKYFGNVFISSFWYGLWGFVGLLLLSLLWWRQRGISQKKTRHVRGTKIVTANQAKRYLKVRLKASPIEIAGVPMVKHTERYHILFVGDSGVGKTVAIKKHLQQIRKLNHKVILVDTAGDLTKYFYREGHDHILNPFDKRCNSWSFWGEITEEPHYEEIMEAAIKNDGKVENGDFWTNASRIVVAEILRELRKRGQTTNKALASHLFYDDLSHVKRVLREYLCF
jgi:hypothetical protein